ncbi:MAG: adenosine deaminase [Chloroflexi bacterium]|nr:adenosine deaminase [Chloroflexota bacterium]
MPKVELHVHLEGAIGPSTLLALADRHGIQLPATTPEGLQEWYTFTGFPHFVEVYVAISKCIKTADDIELIAREFLAGQAAQGIAYSEVTFTAYTHFVLNHIPFRDSLAALNRAAVWAAQALDTRVGWVIDIARETSPEEGLVVADWAIEAMGAGVVALGLGGYEVGHPPEKHQRAFARARAAGLPSVPHAGETAGPASIWGALEALQADRIGHGVRCIEDPALVAELRARQTPLEVCPISNVCIGVATSLADHPLPRLLDEGLYVTLNSDDPPMFNTSLTREYLDAARAFGFTAGDVERLVLNGVDATLLPEAERSALRARFETEFSRLRTEHGV